MSLDGRNVPALLARKGVPRNAPKRSVKLFLSAQNWTLPLNEFGVRQHVAALYGEVFRGCDMHVYPTRQMGNILVEGVRHLTDVLSGGINVLTPGYPIAAGALATLLRRRPRLIVHTWKVPGVSDRRLSARIYDALLQRAIEHADAVVVASQVQKRQIEALGVGCPVLFAPVTVDSDFWHPEPVGMTANLERFGLLRDGYVLTVGGVNRDEIYGARLARELGLPYVRATYEPIERIERELFQRGLMDNAKLLKRPSDTELRSLYGGARIVCLPTITRTNPAGLTSLVEALACGALVGVPESLAEGYVLDKQNAFLLVENPKVFAEELRRHATKSPPIRLAAREYAKDQLSVPVVAAGLRRVFLG